MSVQFQDKFNSLPEALQQEVLQFIEFLLFRNTIPARQQGQDAGKAPKTKTQPASAKTNGTANPLAGFDKPVIFVQHGGKLLPVTPATEKPDIKALSGIWKDKNITQEQLRQEAWGDRL